MRGTDPYSDAARGGIFFRCSSTFLKKENILCYEQGTGRERTLDGSDALAPRHKMIEGRSFVKIRWPVQFIASRNGYDSSTS